MILSKFRDGLAILANYFDKDGYRIGAEHDVFYVFATDRPVSPEDIRRLVDLGWTQNSESWAEDDGDFTVAHYDPAESWSASL